jgi:hypothetical protein
VTKAQIPLFGLEGIMQSLQDQLTLLLRAYRTSRSSPREAREAVVLIGAGFHISSGKRSKCLQEKILNPLRKLTIAAVGAAVIASGVASTSLAEAALFHFDFNGRGTTGHILFDNSILDTNPDPLKGQYLGAIVTFDININGTPQTETGIPTFEIIQGSSGSVIVGLAADGIGACGLTVNCLAFLLGSNVFPPTDPSNFDLTFDYPAGSLLSDALPATVPVTGEAILRNDLQQFFLGLDASASIVPVSVPEPATFWVFAVGAGLTVLRKFTGKLHSGRRGRGEQGEGDDQ